MHHERPFAGQRVRNFGMPSQPQRHDNVNVGVTAVMCSSKPLIKAACAVKERMMKSVAGLYRVVGAIRRTMVVKENDVCALCGLPAIAKVEAIGGGRGACIAHAEEARKRGYRVGESVRRCFECGRIMGEDEHNYGTNEEAGNVQVCIHCSATAQAASE